MNRKPVCGAFTVAALSILPLVLATCAANAENESGWIAFFKTQKGDVNLYAAVQIHLNLYSVRTMPQGEKGFVSSSDLVFVADLCDREKQAIVERPPLGPGEMAECATLGTFPVDPRKIPRKCQLQEGSFLVGTQDKGQRILLDAAYRSPQEGKTLVLRATSGKLRAYWQRGTGAQTKPQLWEIPASWDPLVKPIEPSPEHPDGGFEIDLGTPEDAGAIEFRFSFKEVPGEVAFQTIVVPVLEPMPTKPSAVPKDMRKEEKPDEVEVSLRPGETIHIGMLRIFGGHVPISGISGPRLNAASRSRPRWDSGRPGQGRRAAPPFRPTA